MEKQEAEILYQKYLNGTCTPEEKTLFENLYNKVLQKQGPIKAQNFNAIQTKIYTRLPQKQLSQTPKKSLLTRILPYAAVLILAAGSGLFFYHNTNHQTIPNNLKPGTNKAYLTLSNGQRITLTNAANGIIAQQAGIKITKTTNGQLVYTSGPNKSRRTSLLNTVETPNAGQYQVTLPDGTNIWLNSASTLKYPVTFATQKTRTVQLTGEAYFEVAKDKTHPFIVKSPNQEVIVLGTHFNINSYADEPATKTTLLEGAVLIQTSKKSITLKPNQQSTLSSNTLTVTQVDPQYATAWKDGKFRCKNETLESLLRKIERWYDVEIEYQDPSAKYQTFSGTLSRYDNVTKILKRIELTGEAKFKIENRKIIVTNP